MKLQFSIILAIGILASCDKQKKKYPTYTELNSPEYCNRLKSAEVLSQRVYAIRKSSSEINSTDSIMLLYVKYEDGIERKRVCYSYSSAIPEDDEYTQSSLFRHDVFDIPADYKTICWASGYSYDSLGQMRVQSDSVNWLRVIEYQKRAGLVNKNTETIGNTNDLIATTRRRTLLPDGKEKEIIEVDQYKQGNVGAYKYFDWTNDSNYTIRSLILSGFNDSGEVLSAIRNKQGEIVEVGLRSKSPKSIYVEKYTTPLSLFGKVYSGYGHTPTYVTIAYYEDPKTFVKIEQNVLFKSAGYYDSTVIKYDDRDSIKSEIKYKCAINAIPVRGPNLVMTESRIYQRNKDGRIVSIKEDDYYFKTRSEIKFTYEIEAGMVKRKEYRKEVFNNMGESVSVEVILYSFDDSGNLIEEKTTSELTKSGDADYLKESKRVFAYDAMGNKVSEKEYWDGSLKISKEWKFNDQGLITEYVYSDKKRGINQKLVWVYTFQK